MPPSTPPSGHLLLASARAGSIEQDAVEAARSVLESAGPVEVVETASPQELDAALDGLDGRTLVVAGGDGSLHLTVSRLRQRGELSQVRLGLVPLGTGNDLARCLDLPLDPGDAAKVVLACSPRRLDLIVDDLGGVVINAVHVGVGADAAQQAGRFKARLGVLAFPLGALSAGLRATGWRLRVEVDGRVVGDTHRRSLMVAVLNGPGIGGGTDLVPHAEPDDGQLDVMVSYASGPLARVRFGAALSAGTHLQDEAVRVARGTSVTISGEPVGVNADGEVGDEVRRRTWHVEAGAWSLLRP